MYEAPSGRILGLQAVGQGDVTKRVDTITRFIADGRTIDDLSQMEHAYAPPYSPAIDPRATAAFAAQNQEDGIEAVSPIDPLPESGVLDVRLPDEVEERPAPEGPVPAIPVGELRDNLDSVGRGTGLALCERGTRSAEAVRILRAGGIKARYVGGGLKWRQAASSNGK